MNFLRFWILCLFITAQSIPVVAASSKSTDNSDADSGEAEPTPKPTPLPTPTPTASQSKPEKNPPLGKVLFIHKPMPSPSWGRVIQYHRDQIMALSEKNRETLHEFLFQDDEGVIRTATFHENSSGEGYWEVWIWDQP